MCRNFTPFSTGISIHALHEESDFRCMIVSKSSLSISIHALHEESDTYAVPVYAI